MDGCHSSIDDKKKKKVYVAEAAEEGPAEVVCQRGVRTKETEVASGSAG